MPIDRDKLARRLLAIDKISAPYQGERAEICAALKKEAEEAGGNYQVLVDRQGRVKVSAPHGREPKGETWELDLQAWLKLTQKTRDSLLARGIVKKVTEYSGAYYGGVTVELFS